MNDFKTVEMYQQDMDLSKDLAQVTAGRLEHAVNAAYELMHSLQDSNNLQGHGRIEEMNAERYGSSFAFFLCSSIDSVLTHN